MIDKSKNRFIKHLRVRKKISGTKDRPRLSVFKSAKHIYTQLIDDDMGQTLAAFSDLNLEPSKNQDKKKGEVAFLVGEELAKKAKDKNIQEVVFDRGGFKFIGRIKEVAQGARKGGLIF